jgi:hypothetical protein
VQDELTALRQRLAAAEQRTDRIVCAFNDCIALRNWDRGFEDYADVAELKAALAGDNTAKQMKDLEFVAALAAGETDMSEEERHPDAL